MPVKNTPTEIKETERNCPYTGTISLRGKQFTGVVVRARMQKSCIVEWERRQYVPKYERYLKVKTRIRSHNPPSINAQEGDIVRIMETRPISKTIHTVVIEKIGNIHDKN